MKRVFRLALLAALQCVVTFAWAQDTGQRQLEHQIKAVFLYKFADYVEWPSSVFTSTDSPFTIGVIGADEVAAELVALSNGNSVNNRAVKIRLLEADDNVDDVQILFIGQNGKNHLRRLLDTAQSKPILTVTESKGALSAGSTINFIPVQDYIRFEISVASADSQGIKISARLLDVAQKIEGRRH